MSPKQTRKFTSGCELLNALDGVSVDNRWDVYDEPYTDVYSKLKQHGYRWSEDLGKWVPLKRGENAIATGKKTQRRYVNMYADVKRDDVDRFIEHWRIVADLIDYAIVGTPEKRKKDSATVRVYLRFREVKRA
jgi:hypothetical protein